MEASPKYKVGRQVVYRCGGRMLEGKIESSAPVNYHIVYFIEGKTNAVHEKDIVGYVDLTTDKQ